MFRKKSTLLQRDRHAVLACFLMLLPLTTLGCSANKASDDKKVAPAKLEHPDEGDIYRVVLTAKAEQRLQIRTVPVERRPIPRSRTVGGSLMVPDGAVVLVTSPVLGKLQQPDDAGSPRAGSRVDKDQTVFRLMPLLAPEREVPSAAERVSMANAKASLVSSQIVAEGDVQQGQTQVQAAEIAMARAKQLFQDKVGSQRDVDDAQARLDLAIQGLEAAKARKELLDRLTLDAAAEEATVVPVLSPRRGMLRNVTSSVGQVVSPGAPLFEVVDLRTMWVRVPVYPGLSARVDRQRPAKIRKLGKDTAEVTVTPVAAPPSGDRVATSVDLFYQLDNSRDEYSPGEPVEVVLPLEGQAESLVVPRAAILLDIHGIAWVYVHSAEHEFRRHRVEVNFTTEDLAVLSEGPEVGTPVVVDGTAELFGTEFGAGK